MVHLYLRFRKYIPFGVRSFDRLHWDFTGVAQLVEHWSPKPRVVSSNLTARAKKYRDGRNQDIFRRVVQRIDA
jgi:hypothetical protein